MRLGVLMFASRTGMASPSIENDSRSGSSLHYIYIYSTMYLHVLASMLRMAHNSSYVRQRKHCLWCIAVHT